MIGARALIVAALAALPIVACGGSPPPLPETPLTPPPKPAAPPTVEWKDLTGPVKALDVNVPDATLVPKAKDAMASVIDRPLDRRVLRRALDAVRALPGVAEVAAHGVQLADGIRVVVDITPQPTLHALAARQAGGQDLPLPGQLTAAIGLPVDPQLLDALGVQLREAFLAKGFTDASVEWKQTPASAGAVDVTVEVTPGKASIIASVDFKGNAHAKKADLVKALGDGFAPSSPWNTDVVDRGQFLLAAYYYDHGYINVSVETPRPTGATAPAVFVINEGDQYRIGKVEVTGAPPADARKFLTMIGVKQGEIFNRSQITAGLGKVNDALHAAGQPTASITPFTNIDTKKKTVDIKFEVAATAPAPRPG